MAAIHALHVCTRIQLGISPFTTYGHFSDFHLQQNSVTAQPVLFRAEKNRKESMQRHCHKYGHHREQEASKKNPGKKEIYRKVTRGKRKFIEKLPGEKPSCPNCEENIEPPPPLAEHPSKVPKYKETFIERMIERRKKKKEKKKKIFYSSSSSNSCSENRRVDEEITDCIDNYTLASKLVSIKNVNVNEIKDICKHEEIEICPYYLCKENIKNADIVLLPYICILNEQVRKNLKINIKNNIVIFDESQNIVENINRANSVIVERCNVFFCKIVLREYIKKYEHVLNNNNIIMIKQIIIYCDLLLNSFETIKENLMSISKYMLLSKIDALNLNNISTFLNNYLFCRRIKIFSESYIRTELKNCVTLHAKSSSIYLLMEFTNKLIRSNKYDHIYLNCEQYENCQDNNARPNGEGEKINPSEKKRKANVDRVVLEDTKKKKTEIKLKKNYIKKGAVTSGGAVTRKKEKNDNTSNNELKTFEDAFENVIEEKKINLQGKIEIVSVSACSNFEYITKNCSNIILIGGTLQPLEEFLLLFLNEKKKKIKIYMSDYIFKNKNIYSRILSTNLITYKYIFNTYINRSQNSHLLNLALHIHMLTLHINFGNIVFFSSYNYLKIFIDFLNNEGKYIYYEMRKNKYIFFEKKNDNNILHLYTEKIKIMKKHDNFVNVKNGAILLCVMSGKLSEGINFDDDLCRNIIIVGIPFFKQEKNTIPGKYILNKNSLIHNYYKAYANDIMRRDASQSAISTEEPLLLLSGEREKKKKKRKLYRSFSAFSAFSALSADFAFSAVFSFSAFSALSADFAFSAVFSFSAFSALSADFAFSAVFSFSAFSAFSAFSSFSPFSPFYPFSLKYDEINEMCRTYDLKCAMKIVNQCIGRSLRHADDFSSFFFLDHRFTNAEVFDCLPSFIKNHINNRIKEDSEVDHEKDASFQKERELFYGIYDQIRQHYNKHFPSLHFEEKQQVHLNNFVKDLLQLRQFHEKMRTIYRIPLLASSPSRHDV
ncbi:DEAD box helicase, putative [Plasmodium ovale wallikeri]|uniref:DEAD box helicase, putative n=1 Tax=Plasmodium ovale wallikeri TaxID=864142 RepID=A0A1A8ZBN2_PLAOA|nr:DEAD box helicase, putative [Plasmodium ovale wallikeri]